MFRYAEGDTVALKENYAELGLCAGDTGVIWVLYNTVPPAYDVTFRDAEGRAFDMVLDEDELTAPTPSRELAATAA